MALTSEIRLTADIPWYLLPGTEAEYYTGPNQMMGLDATTQPTPSFEALSLMSDNDPTVWMFGGYYQHPTKWKSSGTVRVEHRYNANSHSHAYKQRVLHTDWLPIEWEERHTGVHYTVQHHGWSCQHDHDGNLVGCDRDHGWIEIVNPGERGLSPAELFESMYGSSMNKAEAELDD